MNSIKVKHMRDLSFTVEIFFNYCKCRWVYSFFIKASNELLIASSGTKYVQGKAQGGGLSVLEKPAGVCTTSLKKITQVFCLVFSQFSDKGTTMLHLLFWWTQFFKNISEFIASTEATDVFSVFQWQELQFSVHQANGRKGPCCLIQTLD